MQYSDRAMAITPFYAMAFGEKATALEHAGHNVIRLNIGEPDFGAPPAVQQAMQQAVAENQLPYTGALGDYRLREAIAGFYQTMHGLQIDPQRVVVTAGASAALLLVCAALVNPGDEVVVFDSTEELQGFYDTLSPDVIVKGSEWTADEVRDRDSIPEIIQVKVYPLVGDYSTTSVMHKIRDMETCEKI